MLTPNGVKDGKLFSIIGNTSQTDMDWSRNTVANRVNKNGLIEEVGVNVPRINHPINGGCPSVLLEPQRTNLITYSNDFSNVSWTKLLGSTVTPNVLTSPKGILDGWSFKAGTVTYSSILRKSIAKSVLTDYSLSIYVKKSNYRYVGLRIGSASVSDSYNFYDFDTDTVDNSVVPNAPIKRVLLSNGWICLSQVYNTQSPSISITDIALVNSLGSVTFTPVGTEEIFVYQAQLEQGSFATSPITTQGATVTRLADKGTNCGTVDDFNSEEGTLFVEMKALVGDGTARYVSISDGTTNNRVIIYYLGISTIGVVLRVNNGVSVLYTDNSHTVTDFNKIAFKWKENDFSLWINGINVYNDNSGIVFPIGTLNTLQLADGNGIGNTFTGEIEQLHVYKQALTDAQIQAL
jgi:hypothetical protein